VQCARGAHASGTPTACLGGRLPNYPMPPRHTESVQWGRNLHQLATLSWPVTLSPGLTRPLKVRTRAVILFQNNPGVGSRLDATSVPLLHTHNWALTTPQLIALAISQRHNLIHIVESSEECHRHMADLATYIK
jgi:hypothetical protein